MARRTETSRLRKLRAEANAVAVAAAVQPAGPTQDSAFAAAERLEQMARREERAAQKLDSFVLTLPITATMQEMRAARQLRAVRRGQDVFLPSWSERTVGMPNALLRSALFSASSAESEWLEDKPIASQSDTTLRLTGSRLGAHHRQIFAACLDYYRDERPLSPGGDTGWIKASYYQFATRMDVEAGPTVYQAIRKSLRDLNCASLMVRVNSSDILLPCLVEAAFDDGHNGDNSANHCILGTNVISFRVLDRIADLFGPNSWSAVSKQALKGYSGLAAWLAAFYRTHKTAHWLPVKDLYARCGVTVPMFEFRRMLKKALTKLQQDTTPADVRVADFKMTTDAVCVYLAAWATKARPVT